MKIFVQHATNPKSEPQQFDSSDWKNLPKKADPTGHDAVINSAKGWIQSISCMGKTFKADHYAIAENPPGYPVGTIKITFWNDSDPDEDERHAGIWYMQKMKLEKINGRQKWCPNLWEERFYSEGMIQKLTDDGTLPIYCGTRLVKIHKFSDFVKPPEDVTRHGVLIDEALYEEYEKEKDHSYREWI